MSSDDAWPLVSVVMANFNGGRHIAAAVRSVLRQQNIALELILSDDGSSDDSIAQAKAAAAGDTRLIIVEGGPRSGPAATRNRALAVARGAWIAIVDSDDYIHPERLARLVRAAERDGADIAADDMLVFYENGERPHAHLSGALTRGPSWISADDYAAANHLFGAGPSLGYLKPIIRRSAALRYDESLRIAEDFDLVMRLLADGRRMRVFPDLTYFYRKHASSISHRLSAADIDAMLAAHDRLPQSAALKARRASLLDARAFTDLIEALKAKKIGAALSAAFRRPSALALLRYPLGARLPRFSKPKPKIESGPPRITLLSRQRVIGTTNGSSTYLLSLVEALRNAGFAVDYLGASPKIFGRWPFLKLRPEMGLFSSYRVHGGLRLDSYVIATDPRIALTAAAAIAERILVKLKLPAPGWSKPADYSIAAKATRADMLYVARHAATSHAVLCDYAFLAPLAPYVLTPDAPVFTLMHDLMSARVFDDPKEKVPDEVAALTPVEEFRLLSLADVVIAIQAAEAGRVSAALPGIRVIVAPHFVPSVEKAQPGLDDQLLFVGSNTAPNVVGLQWFFAHCWPLIRAARPHAELRVAGSVARSIDAVPEGARMLGVVPELDALYHDAGVVISPLRTGSGLKIKLIEALAAGKAMVGTTVTAQGVEDVAAGAMRIEDEPRAFADAVISLLGDVDARESLGATALTCARANFSADACFGELVALLNTRRG